jgi:hypothetical protein
MGLLGIAIFLNHIINPPETTEFQGDRKNEDFTPT